MKYYGFQNLYDDERGGYIIRNPGKSITIIAFDIDEDGFVNFNDFMGIYNLSKIDANELENTLDDEDQEQMELAELDGPEGIIRDLFIGFGEL